MKEEVDSKRIEKLLKDGNIKMKIQDIQKEFEEFVCVDIPNAFWQRKQHIVELLYEKDIHK